MKTFCTRGTRCVVFPPAGVAAAGSKGLCGGNNAFSFFLCLLNLQCVPERGSPSPLLGRMRDEFEMLTWKQPDVRVFRKTACAGGKTNMRLVESGHRQSDTSPSSAFPWLEPAVTPPNPTLLLIPFLTFLPLLPYLQHFLFLQSY